MQEETGERNDSSIVWIVSPIANRGQRRANHGGVSTHLDQSRPIVISRC